MPNVRASSGMIGTTRWPTVGSRRRLRSRTANAMVVDTGRPLDPEANSANVAGAGSGSGLARTTRRGSEPAKARRRIIRYSCSGEPSAGR